MIDIRRILRITRLLTEGTARVLRQQRRVGMCCLAFLFGRAKVVEMEKRNDCFKGTNGASPSRFGAAPYHKPQSRRVGCRRTGMLQVWFWTAAGGWRLSR